MWTQGCSRQLSLGGSLNPTHPRACVQLGESVQTGAEQRAGPVAGPAQSVRPGLSLTSRGPWRACWACSTSVFKHRMGRVGHGRRCAQSFPGEPGHVSGPNSWPGAGQALASGSCTHTLKSGTPPCTLQERGAPRRESRAGGTCGLSTQGAPQGLAWWLGGPRPCWGCCLPHLGKPWFHGFRDGDRPAPVPRPQGAGGGGCTHTLPSTRCRCGCPGPRLSPEPSLVLGLG